MISHQQRMIMPTISLLIKNDSANDICWVTETWTAHTTNVVVVARVRRMVIIIVTTVYVYIYRDIM